MFTVERDEINIRETRWNFHVLSFLIYYLLLEQAFSLCYCKSTARATHIWSEKYRSWILKVLSFLPSCWLFIVQRVLSTICEFDVVICPQKKNAAAALIFRFINHLQERSPQFKWSVHPFINFIYLRLNLETEIMINDDLKMHFIAWWMISRTSKFLSFNRCNLTRFGTILFFAQKIRQPIMISKSSITAYLSE